MASRRHGRNVAGLLSMLVPGAGQLYAGARRPGVALLLATAAVTVAAVLLVATQPFRIATSVVDERAVAALVAVDLALLAFRLFAVVDAWRRGRGPATTLAVAALAGMTILTAAPHVVAGYVTVRGHRVLDAVFADEEPQDVLASRGVLLAPERPPRPYPRHVWPGGGVAPSGDPPPRIDLRPKQLAATPIADDAHPWVTLLLLGSDRGPGNWGERTDTMIVVALERGTGRAAAFGVPRNLAEVPLAAAPGAPRRFHQPLNALYEYAQAEPELFPGGRDPGATALKQTISRLLGLRVDYYALVDLLGFADMVDALGGVDVHVKERIVDEVTRPAWGEPKPSIDVFPGRTYHFFGREALAYVRSRKASNDYTRMARQRCFLGALARQVDPVGVVRHFDALAATIQRSVRTDIPLDRVPDLLRLAKAMKPRLTSTETFGVEYFARRRADRYPIPAVAKIQAAVREAILDPDALSTGRVSSVRQSC